MAYTYATLRSAIASALHAEGLELEDTWGKEPPYVLMFGNGSNMDILPRDGGQIRIAYRLVLIESKATDALSSEAMAADTIDLINAALAIDGVRLDGLSPDTLTEVAGVQFWTTTLTISAMITL